MRVTIEIEVYENGQARTMRQEIEEEWPMTVADLPLIRLRVKSRRIANEMIEHLLKDDNDDGR